MAEVHSVEEIRDLSKVPTYSKSLEALVSSLTHRENDENEDLRYGAVLTSFGLTGDLDERINLATFRRLIASHLNVDGSFMYKRVFNAFDEERKGYLTGKEFVKVISILLCGPFQEHINLGMRVYGKPTPDVRSDPESKKSPDPPSPPPITAYTITRVDAILSIVESLQLSSPRARHTLTTDNREKAYHIGEDLVFIIYPKLDINGDGIVSLDDFTKACHDDPSLVQVFGQFLPRNLNVLPSPPGTPPKEVACSAKSSETSLLERPRSSTSRGSFEGIDYLKHSPTMKQLWGQPGDEGNKGTKSSEEDVRRRRSERLEPIPVVESRTKVNRKPSRR